MPRFSLLSIYHTTRAILQINSGRDGLEMCLFFHIFKQHHVSLLFVRQRFTLPLIVCAQNNFSYFHIHNGGTASA